MPLLLKSLPERLHVFGYCVQSQRSQDLTSGVTLSRTGQATFASGTTDRASRASEKMRLDLIVVFGFVAG